MAPRNGVCLRYESTTDTQLSRKTGRGKGVIGTPKASSPAPPPPHTHTPGQVAARNKLFLVSFRAGFQCVRGGGKITVGGGGYGCHLLPFHLPLNSHTKIRALSKRGALHRSGKRPSPVCREDFLPGDNTRSTLGAFLQAR